MPQNLDCINTLINNLTKLPAVGYKTAERYAYRVIEMSKQEVDELCAALKSVKENVKFCKVCGNFTSEDVCEICRTRSSETICVVAHPKEINVIEHCRAYHGTYHVLHGVLSPLNKKGPEELNLQSLLDRMQDGKTKEIILALSPDVEGEATAKFLASVFKSSKMKVSRLATGIAMGVALEYADELTISTALKNRTEV